MGRVLSRALEAAGLAELQARVASGAALTPEEVSKLRDVDLLLVAGLADSMRAHARGDDVRILNSLAPNQADALVFERGPSAAGATGAELLREIALLRLSTPPELGVAVSLEALGLELAQTALLFGADSLIGDLGSARTLPLLDGAVARRRELEGLVARSGRRVLAAEASREAEERAS